MNTRRSKHVQEGSEDDRTRLLRWTDGIADGMLPEAEQ